MEDLEVLILVIAEAATVTLQILAWAV